MNRMIYVKTTETCQLDCKHCFTNGINGAKIYFNPEKTADWVKRLHAEAYRPNDTIHYEFHGGEPFLAPISHMTKFYEETKGSIKIIGVGGVDSGESAFEKITAGADAVQLYTGMVYKGPAIVKSIKKELISILKKENLKDISQAVGINA